MSDCYKCKHRKDIPGDCHSSCNHPDSLYRFLTFLTGYKLPVKISNVSPQWTQWPLNFDPIWLSDCELFEKTK